VPVLRGHGVGDRQWANEIRERRPSREELTALVDATCPGLPEDQRTPLIDGLRAFVRFAES